MSEPLRSLSSLWLNKMLFLFRQLRRLELRKRSGQYFVYAVGEIVLIVVGILIALQINNWNELRMEDRERQRLVAQLIHDFEVTKQRILAGRKEAAFTLNHGNFLMLTDPLDESIPIEKWEEAAYNSWEKVEFEPLLSTYQSAVDTGKIALLEHSGLLESFAEFNQLHDNYEHFDRLSAEIFYTGANWEAAKEIGSVRLLWGNLKEYPVRENRDLPNLREVYSLPTVIVTVELYWHTIHNMDSNFERMLVVVDRILKDLMQLQDD